MDPMFHTNGLWVANTESREEELPPTQPRSLDTTMKSMCEAAAPVEKQVGPKSKWVKLEHTAPTPSLRAAKHVLKSPPTMTWHPMLKLSFKTVLRSPMLSAMLSTTPYTDVRPTGPHLECQIALIARPLKKGPQFISAWTELTLTHFRQRIATPPEKPPNLVFTAGAAKTFQPHPSTFLAQFSTYPCLCSCTRRMSRSWNSPALNALIRDFPPVIFADPTLKSSLLASPGPSPGKPLVCSNSRQA